MVTTARQQALPTSSSSTTSNSRSKPRHGSLTAKRNPRLFAEHKYHDYANTQEGNDNDDDDNNNNGNGADEQDDARTPKRRKVGGGVSVPFPVKLFDVLDCIQREGKYTHICSWQPHGRCFLIRHPKLFVAEVLPLYFRHAKLTSFQRQLNLYGFGRLTIGPDAGAYYHELFLRGKRFLAWRMPRTRIKGTKIKFASNPKAEPNFYDMVRSSILVSS